MFLAIFHHKLDPDFRVYLDFQKAFVEFSHQRLLC